MQTFLVLWEWGKETEERPELKIFYRVRDKMGNWTWRNRNNDGNLQ